MRDLINLLERVSSYDGDAYFDPRELEMLAQQGDKSRDKLIHMDPNDFLKVAADGFDAGKQAGVDAHLASGGSFNSIPFLGFKHDGEGTAAVTSHEGRHRARALAAKGVKQMPVLLSHRYDGNGQSIRWGSVNDTGADGFKDEWPTTLYGERNDEPENLHYKNSIPFPVDRESL